MEEETTVESGRNQLYLESNSFISYKSLPVVKLLNEGEKIAVVDTKKSQDDFDVLYRQRCCSNES